MTNFHLLNPRYSLVWLPMDGSFRQDVGANLVTDGDMEAVGVANYPSWGGGVTSKSLVAPHSGSQCLNCLTDGTINSGTRIASFSIPANQLRHTKGWGRGDGVISPSMLATGGYVSWVGTTSTSWQYFDHFGEMYVVTGYLYLGTRDAIIGNVGFDDIDVRDYPMVTRSLSRAQNYARLGDGHTAATMPTFISKRGFSFDGGDYINLDWAASGHLDTQTFTVLAYIAPTVPVADGRIYEIGIVGQRYSLYYDLSESEIVWQKDDTVDQTITSGYGYPDGSEHVVAASISVSGMKLYIDDRLVGSVDGDVRLASFDAASKAYFGQDVAGTNLYKGKMYTTAIYPIELTNEQVSEWGRRAKQLRNI